MKSSARHRPQADCNMEPLNDEEDKDCSNCDIGLVWDWVALPDFVHTVHVSPILCIIFCTFCLAHSCLERRPLNLLSFSSQCFFLVESTTWSSSSDGLTRRLGPSFGGWLRLQLSWTQPSSFFSFSCSFCFYFYWLSFALCFSNQSRFWYSGA